MKKNILLALLSGALLACAWVTYGITALIFIALVPLLLMEARLPTYQTQGVCTLLFGFSHLEYPYHLVDMVLYSNRSNFCYFGKHSLDDTHFLPLSYRSETYEPQSVARFFSSDMALF